MSPEQIEQKNNLSEFEREKSAELSKKIESIYDFVNNADDSNLATEMRERIVAFVADLKKEGTDPMGFYLWNLFITHGDADSHFEYNHFDTPDGAIEHFIEELEKLKVETKE